MIRRGLLGAGVSALAIATPAQAKVLDTDAPPRVIRVVYREVPPLKPAQPLDGYQTAEDGPAGFPRVDEHGQAPDDAGADQGQTDFPDEEPAAAPPRKPDPTKPDQIKPDQAASPPARPTLPPAVFVKTPEGARLELPLPPEARFEVRTGRKGWRVYLPEYQPGTVQPVGGDAVLGKLTAEAHGEGTRLTLPWKYHCPTDVAWLKEPSRLAFTFRERFRTLEREDVAPGVQHLQFAQGDPAKGRVAAHALKVNLKQAGVSVAPALAGGRAMFARNTVSWIAKNSGALAGVNGTYFSERTGEPLGLLMVDGHQVSSPLYNRGALGLGAGGEVYIGNTQLTAQIGIGDGQSYDVDGVNQPRGLNRLVLYTPFYGTSTRTQPGGVEFTLGPDGAVLAKGEADSAIPRNGTVLSAQGQAATWLAGRLKPGSHVTLKNPLAMFWPNVKHVMAGGPVLLTKGAIVLDADRERFKPDIARGVAPRTAVGRTADGQLLVVAVDGRDPWDSRGLSLAELAALMQELGAVDALNLDGGGSTAMTIGGRCVNHPSDGRERAVSNALLIFAPANKEAAHAR